MRKNDIYLDLLHVTLIHLRMVASSGLLYRIKDRSALFETDLIHKFHVFLSEDEFGDDDIQFLNYQARYYYENCNQKISMLYNDHLESFSKLFSLVPEHLQAKLEWKGPRID